MEKRYFPATLSLGHRKDGQRAEDALAPDEKGRIPVALSSEYGVKRWDWDIGYYTEVLEHTEDAVNLERAALGRGLPILLCHDHWDSDSHVGKVEDITIDGDRVMRGWMRFSKGARAQEIKQDVLDDIRTTVSIGYDVGDTYEQKEDKKTNEVTRVFRDWQPLELSLVPIPADPMVGAGRSHDGKTVAQRMAELAAQRTAAPTPETPAPVADPNRVATATDPAAPAAQPTPSTERSMDPEKVTAAATPTPEPNAADLKVVRAEIQKETGDRVRQYGEIVNLAPGMPADTVARWISSETPVGVALAEARAHIETKAAEPIKPTAVGLSEKEAKRFSYAKAIIAQCQDDARLKGGFTGIDTGFEREVMQETLIKMPHLKEKARGLVMPSILMQATAERLQMRTGYASDEATKGAALVFNQPGEFIDLLRNRMLLYRAGATLIPGLSGPLVLPRQNAAGTLSWYDENPGSGASITEATIGSVTLAMKSAISVSAYTKQMLIAAANNYSVEEILRNDLANIFALGIDSVGLNGGGSNEPSGILQHTGIGSVTIGADGGAIAYGHVVDLETVVANANGDYGRLAYFTNPTQRGKLKKLYNVNSTYGTSPMWGGQLLDGSNIPQGILNNYPAFASNQLPTNLTKGTATTICSPLFFGDVSQVLIGEFGGFDILTDPYTKSDEAKIRVIGSQFVGVAIRQWERLAAIKDAR